MLQGLSVISTRPFNRQNVVDPSRTSPKEGARRRAILRFVKRLIACKMFHSRGIT